MWRLIKVLLIQAMAPIGTLQPDVEGETLVMERFAVAGATVYGTTGQYVYRLKEGSSTWKQVTPEIPDSVAFVCC